MNFFKSSIGQKFLMSVTGLFLIVFLCVHLIMNLLLLFDSTGTLYNEGAHFMGTNPLIRVVEPILALGFVLHIVYASVLTLKNQKARPVRYAVVNQSESSKWASRNMFVLGGLVFVFIVLHLTNFYVKMKFGEMPKAAGTEIDDAYTLVSNLFGIWWYSIIYVIGAILLGLHLHHAFWSAFQTLGLSNELWRKRLDVVGLVYTLVIAGGFAIIPLKFLLF